MFIYIFLKNSERERKETWQFSGLIKGDGYYDVYIYPFWIFSACLYKMKNFKQTWTYIMIYVYSHYFLKKYLFI